MVAKKWWMVGGAVLLVVAILGIETTFGILRGGRRLVKDTVVDLIPLEVDLKNLYESIDALTPAIRQAQQVVAQLEVDTEYREKDVAALRESQEKARAEMKKLRDALAEGKDRYEFGGRQYTRQEVEQDLNQRLEAYKLKEAELKAKEELLEQQKQRLAASRQKVTEFRQQKELLVAKAENLQSQLKMIRSQQAIGKVQVDESKLASAQSLAEQVEKRIKVLAKTLEEEERGSQIPVEVDTRSAVEKFDEMFGSQNE